LITEFTERNSGSKAPSPLPLITNLDIDIRQSNGFAAYTSTDISATVGKTTRYEHDLIPCASFLQDISLRSS